MACILAGALAACSGNRELICDAATDYLDAGSAGRLRIPDDLSVPDETESLRIPDPFPRPESGEEPPQRCLEASPGVARND